MKTDKNELLTITELEQIRQRAEDLTVAWWHYIANARQDVLRLITEVETLITEKATARRMLDELIGEMANAAEAGYALADPTILRDLEKMRKELIDHGE